MNRLLCSPTQKTPNVLSYNSPRNAASAPHSSFPPCFPLTQPLRSLWRQSLVCPLCERKPHFCDCIYLNPSPGLLSSASLTLNLCILSLLKQIVRTHVHITTKSPLLSDMDWISEMSYNGTNNLKWVNELRHHSSMATAKISAGKTPLGLCPRGHCPCLSVLLASPLVQGH